MRDYQKKIRRLTICSIKAHFITLFAAGGLIIIAIPLIALSQKTSNETIRSSNSERQQKAGRQSTGDVQQAIVPLADHHTHIWSLNASTLVTEPILPAVNLPEDLTRLLREREKGWNERAVLSDLYTEDALMLDAGRSPVWIKGRSEIADQVSLIFARPYSITPVSYQVNDSAGFIAGYFTRQDGNTVRHIGNVLLSLKKINKEKWQIAAETLNFPGPPTPKALSVEQLVREMDDAGVKRAAVLSVAYWFGNPRQNISDEYAKVRAENDWVAEQVARFPSRLVGFCSFNPLKDYAMAEINRCAESGKFKGLKLHVGNSRIDMLDAQHVEKLRAVFRAADEKRIPIVIHLLSVVGNYGRAHSEVFLNQVLPAAPNIPIQIAHLGAAGPGYTSDDAFEVYAKAAAAGDPRMKNVYVDIASNVIANTPLESLELVAKRLRQFGLRRVLFASDRSPKSDNEPLKDAWNSFRRLPLTEQEFKTVAENVAPYMR